MKQRSVGVGDCGMLFPGKSSFPGTLYFHGRYDILYTLSLTGPKRSFKKSKRTLTMTSFA